MQGWGRPVCFGLRHIMHYCEAKNRRFFSGSLFVDSYIYFFFFSLIPSDFSEMFLFCAHARTKSILHLKSNDDVIAELFHWLKYVVLIILKFLNDSTVTGSHIFL